MATDLTPFVLDAFKTHLNPPDLHARAVALPCGELFITLFTSQPTPAMHQLARDLQNEFDEMELTVHIDVRRTSSGIGGWLARWGRRLLGFR